MKRKMLLLILAAMLFSMAGAFAQPDLNIVWEKMIWPTEIKFAKFSKDGQWIYCAINNTIVKMNPQNGEFVSTFDNSGVSDIYDMDISELGNLIITYQSGSAVHIWDTKTEKVLKTVTLNTEVSTEVIHEVAISPDERYLVMHTAKKITSDPDAYSTHLVKYDITSDSIVSRVYSEHRVTNIKYSHDGTLLAIGRNSNNFTHNRLELWSADSLKQIATLEDVEGSADYKKFQFSNDGKYLGSLKMWNFKLFDLETKEMVYFSGTARGCHGFGIYPESNYMLLDFSRSDSGFVELYDISNLSLKKRINWNGTAVMIEQYEYSDNTILSYLGGGIVHSLLSNKTVGVNEENLNVSIEANNYVITINSIELIKEVKIIDSLGNILIVKNLISNSQNSTQIEHSLSSGTYICVVKTLSGQEYSKSFQVVR